MGKRRKLLGNKRIDKKTYLKVKSFLDFILAFLGIVLLSPVFLITALAIKIDSNGPIIFKQYRLGKDGKMFIIYKFRSMIINAEQKRPYTIKGDTRITTVGNFIRTTCIDELPQLVNILKGDMSFIGPRPLSIYDPYQYDKYPKKYLKRFEIKPGLTGLSQINGHRKLSWKKRFEYDIEYVNSMCFSLDFKILIHTICVVILKNNY